MIELLWGPAGQVEVKVHAHARIRDVELVLGVAMDIAHDRIAIEEDPGRGDLEAEQRGHAARAVDKDWKMRCCRIDDRPHTRVAQRLLRHADDLKRLGSCLPDLLPPGQMLTAGSPRQEQEQDRWLP